jgi:ATP/maltotriose-dependent transcriptional regulator MalT
MMFEAVDELIQVGDRVAALTLLDRVSMSYVSWGQFTALLKWNGRMSLEEGRRYPRAFTSWLWAEMFCGNTALVSQVLERFRGDLGTVGLSPELEDNLVSLEIINAGAADQFAVVRERAPALKEMHNANSWAGTSLANTLTVAELAAGDIPGARTALESARRTARTSDRALNHAYSDVLETMVLSSELRLAEAIETSQVALKRAISTRGPYSHAAGICASPLRDALRGRSDRGSRGSLHRSHHHGH